jgi:hypothetical protein
MGGVVALVPPRAEVASMAVMDLLTPRASTSIHRPNLRPGPEVAAPSVTLQLQPLTCGPQVPAAHLVR